MNRGYWDLIDYWEIRTDKEFMFARDKARCTR